jgi:hypothetical protein
MFFRKNNLCPGSGKPPIKMRVAYIFRGQEIDLAEFNRLHKQHKDKEVQVVLVRDDNGDYSCPVCNEYMLTGDTTIDHVGYSR